ncbi:hypothetical protein [Thalassobius sp. I31.1]|uniref:hypothetical protein n=1 Tax=Thalassobius sp. I31.1 TaxID=2109912 RepID=UPI001300B428|nr:hypothetical protein [Thalassobius sp. I31.1]
MFGSLLFSLNNKITFGAPSEGGGGGNGGSGTTVIDGVTYSPGDTLPDGSTFLGTIVAGGGGIGNGGEGGDGGSFSGGSSGGAGGSSNPEPSVEIVDIQYVETAIITGGSASISGPVTLLIAEEYIIEHGANLETAYTSQQEIISSLGWADLSSEQIQAKLDFYSEAHIHLEHVALYDDGVSITHARIETALQVTESHLQARTLVQEGHTIAEAMMLANGTTADEFVFTDEAGNYAEADVINSGDVLVSSGIDLTDGLMIIEPNTDRLPSFAIPVQPGIEEYSTDSMFYHDYDSSVSVPLNGYDALRFSHDGLAALEDALIANPTPGDDSAATINGTVNDVGNLTILDGNTNFVSSFVVENPNPNQSDIVVNYTIENEHVLAHGYVGRMIQRYDNTPDDLTDEDYSYSLVTFGEGDAFIQGVIEGPAELVADYEWYQNSYEIFDTANDSLL